MEKLVVVSGGSKGIGKAVAHKFLSKGYTVVTCSRSNVNLENLKTELGSEKLHTFVADMSQKEEVKAFGTFIKSLNLPLAALVNNAGVFIPGKILEEDEENLETQINTNVYSAYYLTRELRPILTQTHVFNICSIASLVAYPYSGSYSISKFALLGFSKSLREELKNTQNKVTSVMPGATFTDSWAGTDQPESRFIKASDVADAIWSAYKLSESAVLEELVIRPQLGDL